MIKVIEPGLYSNIQDYGRFGYRNIGVPYSGFMDQESARTANKIVGNDENGNVPVIFEVKSIEPASISFVIPPFFTFTF